MKNSFLYLFIFFTLSNYAQNRGLDSWSIGAGVSNFIMQGDLRTLSKIDEIAGFDINLGYNLYVDKMITPAFGFELRGHYTSMSGGAFELTDGFNVYGTNLPLGNTRFDGKAYGADLNAIINLSSLANNPYRTKERKLNFASYVGIGWHSYDSKLYEITSGDLLVDYGNSPSTDGIANSIYFTAALGLKYKLSNNINIELRQDFNMDHDDLLDAARSEKSPIDFFYNTSLGLVFNLNKKDVNHFTWLDGTEKIIDEKEVDVATKEVPEEIFIDSDGDGVIDKFDKEENTPKGAFVYANGVTIDTDKDGFPDHIDDCPTIASKTNNGCPGDSDNDGITDNIDMCPKIAGPKSNNGCPKTEEQLVDRKEILSIEPIYFDLNSFRIKKEFYEKLNRAALVLSQNPNIAIILEGHADNRGNNDYNQRLSEKRVKSVKNALKLRGVHPDRILTEGYGSLQPTYDANSQRSFNRRVDIIISK